LVLYRSDCWNQISVCEVLDWCFTYSWGVNW